MEKEIKIVIPSHRRAGDVITTKIVQSAILCVSKSQTAEYKEKNPGIEIVTHPDSIVGLPRKRQWIYDYFKDCWMLDDDLLAIKKVYDDDYDLTPGQVTRNLRNIYELACDLDVFLFGISKNPRPIQYYSHMPILLTGFISGGAFGIREPKRSKLYFNPLILNNDFWISLLNAHINRKCLIDTRFALIQKDTFKSKGGNSEYLSKEGFQKSYNELKRSFGDAVERKKDRPQAKSKVNFALTGRINF